MAEAWLASQEVAGHRPVYTRGSFSVPGLDGLWHKKSHEAVQVEVAQMFNDCKRCKKTGDYRQIVDHASSIAEDALFFDGAPPGVATPSGFHILSGRRVERVALDLNFRQPFRLSCEPDFDAESPHFDLLMNGAFAGDFPEEQKDLLAQGFGTILFGQMPRQQLVLLLLGREKSGKSTLQRVLQAMFPPEAVSAVAPSSWSREYNVAAMAGKRLNLVGELADDHPIPAASFKNVTGANLIEARHPNHRPFYYVCQAGHVFASNVLPPTTDRTEAFFRRWRVVRFSNRVPDDQADPYLLERIIADEMPAVLAWAFRGAERAAERGTLRTTPAHEAVIAKWKAAANPVLQFLLDEDWVRLDPSARNVGTREAFAAYRRWASEVGMRNPFGRNHFLELIDSTGSALGVGRVRGARPEVVGGIELVQSGVLV